MEIYQNSIKNSYMCNSNSSDEINFAIWLHEMHLRHHTANVASQSHQNLDSAAMKVEFELKSDPLLLLQLTNLLRQSEKSNIIFRIRAKLRHTDEIDSLLLGVETRRQIVAVALIVTVVETKKLKKFACMRIEFLLNHFVAFFVMC